MRHRLSLLVGTVAVTAAFACAPREAARTVAPSVIPAIRVQTLDGNTTDLAGVLHGRPALVNLWATWCDSCLKEAPALNRLHAETQKGGDALVVGVAVGETKETVLGFTKTRPLEYTLLVDPDFDLADTLGERQVPATLVVDRAGRIVFRGKSLDADSLAAFRKVSQQP